MPAAVSPPAAKVSVPRPVMIIAITLIVGGALLMLRNPNLVNILIAGFEIALGIGLLKLHPGFRIATLVWLGTVMGLFGLNLVFILLTRGEKPLFGGKTEPLTGSIFALLIFTLAALGYRILKRPAIQALFYRNA